MCIIFNNKSEIYQTQHVIYLGITLLSFLHFVNSRFLDLRYEQFYKCYVLRLFDNR